MRRQATFIGGAPGDTRRYRVFHPAEALHLHGWDVRVVGLEDPGAWRPEDIREGEVLILHRVAWSDSIETAVSNARRRGCAVLFDTDDLVFVPEAEPRFAALRAIEAAAASGSGSIDSVALGFAAPERYLETLLACDGCLAASAPIAREVIERGRPADVVANAIDLELLRLSTQARAAAADGPVADRIDDRSDHRVEDGLAGRTEGRMEDRIVIGYASGTATHDADLEVALPALEALLARDPRVVLRLIGHTPTGGAWDEFGERIERVPYMAWRRLPAALARLDIAIAPLEADDAFARAKSELKFIEAGAVGVPTVATPTPAFRRAIRHREDGMLASTQAEWESALGELVEDVSLRRRLGAAARAAVLDGWVTDVRAPALVDAIDRLGAGQPMEHVEGSRAGVENVGSRASIDFVGGLGESEPEMGRVVEALIRSAGVHSAIDGDGEGDVEIAIDVAAPPPTRLALGVHAALRGPADLLLLDDEPAIARHAMGDESVLARRVLSGLAGRPYALEGGDEPPAAVGFGPWIGAWLSDRYGTKALPGLPFPLDVSTYLAGAAAAKREPIVVLEVREAAYLPDPALGLRTIERIGVLAPEAERIVFTDRSLDGFEGLDALIGALERMGARWGGRLDENARADLLRRAAAIIVPSCASPPPIAYQAMACGCAVVAPDVGANRWLLVDGQTAATAPPGQDTLAWAAAKVVRDPVLRERIADGAAAMVERMSVGRAAAALGALLDSDLEPPYAVHPPAANALILDRLQGLDDEHEGPRLGEARAGVRIDDEHGDQGSTVGQSFVCRFDGLTRFDVRLRRAPDGAGLLRLTLRDHAGAAGVVAVAEHPGPFAGGRWLPFEFAPIAGSAGRSYHAELAWIGDGKSIALPELESLSIDAFADGRTTRNGVVDPALTLAFRTWCRPPAPPPTVAANPDDRPISGALQLVDQREITLQRQVRVLEDRWPFHLAAWLSPSPPPLPPLDQRPWSPMAPLPAKLFGTLRHYGPAALIAEIGSFGRWRRLSDPERVEAQAGETGGRKGRI